MSESALCVAEIIEEYAPDEWESMLAQYKRTNEPWAFVYGLGHDSLDFPEHITSDLVAEHGYIVAKHQMRHEQLCFLLPRNDDLLVSLQSAVDSLLKTGDDSTPISQAIAEYIAAWDTDISVLHPKTSRNSKISLNEWARNLSLATTENLKNLTIDDVVRIQKKKLKDRPLSPDTLRKDGDFLKRMFLWAAENKKWGITLKHPLCDWSPRATAIELISDKGVL
jgi:hypothetical protein